MGQLLSDVLLRRMKYNLNPQVPPCHRVKFFGSRYEMFVREGLGMLDQSTFGPEEAQTIYSQLTLMFSENPKPGLSVEINKTMEKLLKEINESE